MKRIFLAIATLAFASMQLNAQSWNDTVFGKFPNYFYNWYDSVWTQPMVHDGWECSTGEVAVHLQILDTVPNSTWPSMIKGIFPETAVAYVPDSCLHLIGVAFGIHDSTDLPAEYYLYYNWNDEFALPQSYQNTAVYQVTIYDKHMTPLQSVSVPYLGGLLPGRRIPVGFYPNIGNATVFSLLTGPVYCRMGEVYLDTPMDMTDTFYISRVIINKDTLWPYNDICMHRERHIRSNSKSVADQHYLMPWEHYRFRSDIDTGQWREDYTFGWQHAIMYPIISNPGDSCPQVRGVEVTRSSATQVFLRWQGGVNHSGWQVAYGPAGTPPEDCTVAGEYTQPLSGLITVDPDSQYVAYVRARCRFARDEWGDWSDPVTIWINESSAIGGQPSGWRLAVSPNPAHGTVTVAASIAVQHVEVYDQQGRQVLSHTPDKAPATSLTLDISALPPAVYTLLVGTAAGTQSRQLTVAR